MESFEKQQSHESKEAYTSRISLMFFRHGEKESDPEKSDSNIELTPEGKKQALEKPGAQGLDQSLAFGSPRIRAQETAGFYMADRAANITGTESLDELRSKLDTDLDYGSKIQASKNLDFTVDSDSPFGSLSWRHIQAGDYLKFLIEKSDQLAEETGDKTSATYSRNASNIAEIISKYVQVSKRWDKLVQDTRKNYTNTLERFFGTHQSVAEAFLAKIIEKTKGVEERDRFVELLHNQGFDFTEGFKVEIVRDASDAFAIRVQYEKESEENGERKSAFTFDEEIPVALLESLIIKDNDTTKEV